jgi:hypothetical protein
MRKGGSVVLFLLLAVAGYAQLADVSVIAGGEFGGKQSGTPDTSQCNPLAQPHCFFSVDTTNGGSFALDVTPAIRFAHFGPVSLGLEVPIVFVPSRKTTGSTNTVVIAPNGTFGGSAALITPSVRVKLLSSAWVSPWISAGGGWSRISFDLDQSTVLNGHPNSRSSATPQVGLGADIRTSLKVLLLRGEVRNYWTETPFQQFVTKPNRPHQLFVGGGVVLAF